MSIKGIDNVGVAAGDVEVVARFFEEKLGLAVARGDDGGWAVVTVGDRYLYVFATSSANGTARDRTASMVDNPRGVDHISFAVDSVDEAHRELSGKGVPFEGDPETVEAFRMRLASFRDPEGNLYYLVQNL